MSIKQYKNKYKGNRVFIVGNGGSLRYMNLDLLKDEYSFAMNRISLIYNKTKWRPSFFICTTTNIEDPQWRKDIMTTVNLGIPSFVWSRLKNYFSGESNICYLNCTNGKEVTNEPGEAWWSNDPAKRVTKFGTSLIVAMQIAVYMGFNPIYLIGCDLNYSERKGLNSLLFKLGLKSLTADKNHFDSRYNTPGLPADQINMNMIAAHKLIKKNTDKLGVKVYNSTIGGSLEIYQRKDFKKLFKHD